MNNATISKCATIMLVMGLSYFAYCDGVASNAVSAVRTKIDNCVAALPHDGRGDPGYMREFGLPGDIVTCRIGGEVPHIMIVSDRKSLRGIPLATHNIGGGTREEDCLFEYKITGHYRLEPDGNAEN